MISRATSRPWPGSPSRGNWPKPSRDADPAVVKAAARLLEVLVDGRDEDLDVRWRLVDDAGRPIGITAVDVTAALKQAKDSG